MSTDSHATETQDDIDQIELLDQVINDLDAGNHETIKLTLEVTHPSIVANLIESLSGAVLRTTVTDIIGFLSFIGLASLFLL